MEPQSRMRRALSWAWIVMVLSCTGSGAEKAGAGEAAGASALVQGSGPQIDAPCDPLTDGWRPEPLTVPPQTETQVARGEPAFLPVPPDYQHLPPYGVAHCLTIQRVSADGASTTNLNLWAVRCQTDADCSAGSRCPVDYADLYCSVECEGADDCIAGKGCRVFGDKGLLTTCQ